MYRLMKSEKFVLDHPLSGPMSLYRQLEVDQFRQFRAALTACEAANGTVGSRYYVLNESGEEYYDGSWIN